MIQIELDSDQSYYHYIYCMLISAEIPNRNRYSLVSFAYVVMIDVCGAITTYEYLSQSLFSYHVPIKSSCPPRTYPIVTRDTPYPGCKKFDNGDHECPRMGYFYE